MCTVMCTVTSMGTKNKRDKGTGSIFQRKDGMWVGSLEAGFTSKGRRRQIRVYAKTKKAVLVKLRDREREIARNGLPAESVQRGKNVKSWCEEWSSTRMLSMATSSQTADKSAINQWIIPTIGHLQLEKLGAIHVRAVHNAMRKAGRAQSSIVRCHSTMMKLLKTASAEGYSIPAGVFHVDPPALGKSGREDIPLDDAKKILIKASEMEDAARWYLAFFLAMRPAEVLGLTWAMVDFEHDTLTVKYQLKSLRKDPERPGRYIVPDAYLDAIQLYMGYHLVSPKTDSGVRTLPLIEPVRTALAHWKNAQGGSEHDLVFPRTNGQPLPDKDDRRAWKALCEASEVNAYDLYSCRHTAVSLLREIGAPEEVIEMIAGHSSFSSTKAYLHPKFAQAQEALGGVASKLIEP